jgi:hypothetical protein
MGLLKSPLAPIGICTVVMGAAASFVLNPFVGMGAILFGACLMLRGLGCTGDSDE